MLCFVVPYSNNKGTYTATKWAETPEEALRLVKSQHADCGLGLVQDIGIIKYGSAIAVDPQPFDYGKSRKIEHAQDAETPLFAA
jgi:hypothetical protein